VQSAADLLMGLQVRIPPEASKSVCWKHCVLSGRGLYFELFSRLQESYRLWCVVVYDLETSRVKRLRLALGRSATAQFCILPTQCIYVANKQRFWPCTTQTDFYITEKVCVYCAVRTVSLCIFNVKIHLSYHGSGG
jgi:hypothetical protein